MPVIERNKRRTKIVCTLGPATDTPEIIERAITAGMNVARFNLSHGSLAEHSRRIRTVRDAATKLEMPCSILIDLPGPKYRTGKQNPRSIMLKNGQDFTLTMQPIVGNQQVVSVNLPGLAGQVKPDDTILLNDGIIELRVRDIAGDDVRTRVIVGGELTEGRGVAVPGMLITGAFLTESLKKFIDYTVSEKPDYLTLSFVQKPEDINQVREFLRGKNAADIPICAKIERAIERFDAILEATDAVMIGRGDLGVDIPIQRIPVVQKKIIRKCNMAAKGVITATQMLESMVHNARPTRAEVTDIANAIFDGTDAVMLSEETTIGEYPVEAVQMMADTAVEAEKALPYEEWLREKGEWVKPQTDDLISYNACYTAARLGAVAIIAFTQSGSTARRVAKFRPRVPIIAITASDEVTGRLGMWWNVQAINMGQPYSTEHLIDTGTKLARESGIARPGDLIIITGGSPLGVPGTTNFLKVQRV
jgi:pyruvate kinase